MNKRLCKWNSKVRETKDYTKAIYCISIIMKKIKLIPFMFAIWDTITNKDWQAGTVTAIQAPHLVVYIHSTKKYDMLLFEHVKKVNNADLVLK